MPKRTGHTINTRHSRLARTERPALLHEIAIAVVVPIANLKRLANTSESAEACPVMRGFWRLIWDALTGLVRSRAALQTEIIVLRHQLNVLRRKSPKRLAFSNIDRLVFTGLYGLTPSVLNALKILKSATVIAWHRAGFRAYWRWKSRPRGGRPKIGADIRQLIGEMSVANPLWGAPRIHGELLYPSGKGRLVRLLRM